MTDEEILRRLRLDAKFSHEVTAEALGGHLAAFDDSGSNRRRIAGHAEGHHTPRGRRPMTDEAIADLMRSLGENPWANAIRNLTGELIRRRKKMAVMEAAFRDLGQIEQPALELARKQERERILTIIEKDIERLQKDNDGWVKDQIVPLRRLSVTLQR